MHFGISHTIDKKSSGGVSLAEKQFKSVNDNSNRFTETRYKRRSLQGDLSHGSGIQMKNSQASSHHPVDHIWPPVGAITGPDGVLEINGVDITTHCTIMSLMYYVSLIHSAVV